HVAPHQTGAPSRAGLAEGVEPLAFEDLVLPSYRPRAVLDDDVARGGEELFPPEILALDGRSVAIEGFMMPLDYLADRVSQFVLSPYPPGCCFGGLPGMDEWVDVEVLDPAGCEYFAYRTIRVTGTFEVGEVLDDYGYVSSVYRLRATAVERLW
ncbi:MAG TPA: DUF3299 domain-containing protein, partial [Planctomycetota bacterium]|nr:DUF3299 domain-containing protein [Planctomycetota bacterium]